MAIIKTIKHKCGTVYIDDACYRDKPREQQERERAECAKIMKGIYLNAARHREETGG